MIATENAKEIVLECVNAVQNQDFQRARELVDSDFSFDGVLGSVRGADSYFRQMEKLRFKYNVKKVFADANDMCLLSDILMDGKSVFTCSWYRVDAGKIRSLRVVFDPRPVLESGLHLRNEDVAAGAIRSPLQVEDGLVSCRMINVYDGAGGKSGRADELKESRLRQA